MKVLHVYKDYYPVLGGIENHIRILVEGLIQRGVEAQVLVTNTGPRTGVEEIGGVPVVRAGCRFRVSGAPLSLDLYRWMRRLQPDIAHLHFPNPTAELGELVLGRGRRLVISYHSDIIRQRHLLRVYRPFLWRILTRADRIIAATPNYVRSSPFLSQAREKCVIIPYGIDLARFQGAEMTQIDLIRARYAHRPLLLFVGRLRYYKGLQYLLQGMRGVNAQLLVVGTGTMENEWQTLAETLAVSDRVAFLGDVSEDDLPLYYHACDLFVLPASHRSEAFGLVQVEAMACGKPVISTELGTGTSYVNVHGETGLVVPARDSQALAGAITHLLGDESLRRRLGKQARERVREFSKESMVDRTAKLYEELMSD